MNFARRKLILFLATLPAIASADIQKIAHGSGDYKLQFLGLLNEVGSVSAVGRAYLVENPSDSNADKIINKLFDNESVRKDFFFFVPDKQRKVLGKMIGADFQQGRLMSVNGWLLSQTEARVFALISML